MKYIYHITKEKTWDEAKAKGTYDYCTLKTSGFIHCSTDQQYLGVANTKFKGHTDLVLLKLEENKIREKIVYENLEGGQSLFPHIYGPLNIGAVVETLEFKPKKNGLFDIAH